MKMIDLHCDALLKLYESKGTLPFKHAPEIETNMERLQAGCVKVQCFAIFIPSQIKADEKFQAALDQVDYFYTEVLGKNPNMKQIKEWDDFERLNDNEIGAMLTLEGVDAIGNDIKKLRILYYLGVRIVGLTWNHANLAADGVGEPRGGGLTTFGNEIVQFHNEHKLMTDVSHLSEKAFWDVIEAAHYPIASHSNAKAICDHRRNLTNKQAEALFAKNGMIHIVFYPPFVTKRKRATIADVIRHIDHFCALGGVKQIGFGSDFDGIDMYVEGLEDASQYPNLINELLKYYSEEQVKGFASLNFLNHLPK
ncbi:dipeptidase [Bacillus chungangensis]|uniref:Membrane dipeptidase n=1 Tax=Bacillus chungangensis TaxID=587633 RepID=A0ABT9WZC2_9BACI|nr:dipeptidase [Bacillus chungangensis]MDQ0178531.1 membrane dipeptidase [Bacillus chungangensis]